MQRCADLVVRHSDGTPIVVVEVKNRKDLSKDVAADLRRFYLEQCSNVAAPFFLLVSQDKGFLWTESEQKQIGSAPRYEFSLDRIMSRYLPQWQPSQRLRNPELRLLLFQWLIDISWTTHKPDEEPEKSLDETGLIEAIRGAKVSMEEAA